MGCLASTQRGSGEKKRWPKNIGEVAVFVPGIRIPKPVDFSQPFTDGLSRNLVERLSALRTRIVVMAGQEAPMATKPRRAATQHGGSTLADLQQALEDYLPVLLGLAENGNQMQHELHFSWLNQEDTAEETTMSSSWYEVLSVLHLMAVLSLSQANLLLLPITANDAHLSKLSEERRRTGIDILLKAAGYLEFCIQHVLPQFPPELRKDLPLDLTERVLQALCLQALGQVVDVQLGMAIESVKATLAVKRRLACEMVKYWHQAQENTLNLPLANGWVEKHQHFIRWKYAEAKAAAYYYHGSILEEGNTEISEEMAVAAQQAAEVFHKESKKACEYFHMTPPSSRNPTLWGTSKFLSEKIARDKPSKAQSNEDLLNHEMILRSAPALPEFALSLKPDEYQLPPVDASWNSHLQTQNAVSAQ
ncbi:Endosomal targeting BRO1-like domain-containing protein [Euphorbia peplus]|nr:Endosomal targeting BRO1-like domain-containing protein [Euphorbia peplus]